MRLLPLLLCLAIALPALAQSDQHLIDRFDRAMAGDNHDAAVDAAQTLATRHPTSSVWAYNAACANARAGHLDAAATWITAAADRGFQGVRSFETDADLDPIRDTPEFGAALAKVRAAADARLRAFQQSAESYTPPSFVPDAATPANPAPLVIALHGTGGRGQQMLDAWKDACAEVGCVLVAPDALRDSPPGFAWTYRDESEWLIARTLEHALAELPVDPARVILTGFSQGANIAIPQGLDNPGPWLAVIPVAGHYEPQVARLPTAGNADNAAGADLPKYYFLIGARDPWSATFRDALKDFKAAGVDTRLEVVPNMGHAFPTGHAGAARLARALRWCLRGTEDADSPATGATPTPPSPTPPRAAPPSPTAPP